MRGFFLSVRFNLDYYLMRIMGQAVHHSVGHDFVREDTRPVVNRPVAGEDDGSESISGIDDGVEPACKSL